MTPEIQKEVELLRGEIKRRGFMSEAQIRSEIATRNYKSDKNELLPLIECEDIKIATYTNQYLNGLAVRKLYYYNYKEKNEI